MSLVKPIHEFLLVEMSTEFNNRIRISDTKELYLDTSYEHYIHVCQEGIVYEQSDKIKDVKIGDKVWFHHFVPVDVDIDNIPRSMHDKVLKKLTDKRLYWVDAKSRDKEGANQLFLYENADGVHSYQDTVMIKPIIVEGERTKSGIYLEAFAEKEIFEEGEIVYSNKYLRSQGFVEGDKVKFAKNSEYELTVNGDKLYRMRTTDIILKYEEYTRTA